MRGIVHGLKGDPGPLDHFSRLGLPPSFRLDEADLEQRFRRLQAAVHPDRFATGSEVDRRLALRLAADGNEAYRVLRHPTRRAAYLCELRGVDVGAQTHTSLDPAFLETQMHWREQLDEATDLGAEARRDALAALTQRLDSAIAAARERLAGLIDDEGQMEAAAAEIRELMFYDKLIETVKQARAQRPTSGGAR